MSKKKHIEIANILLEERQRHLKEFEFDKATTADVQKITKIRTPGESPMEIGKEMEVIKLFKELASSKGIENKKLSEILYLMYIESKKRKI